MIGRIALMWLALSGAFLLGWWACIRLHLSSCQEDKVWLLEVIESRDRKIADLERQRESS